MKKYEEVMTFYYTENHYKNLVLKKEPDYLKRIPIPVDIVQNFRNSIKKLIKFLKNFESEEQKLNYLKNIPDEDNVIGRQLEKIISFQEYLTYVVDNNAKLFRPTDQAIKEEFDKKFNIKYFLFDIVELDKKYEEFNANYHVILVEKCEDEKFQNSFKNDKDMIDAKNRLDEFEKKLDENKKSLIQFKEMMFKQRAASNEEQHGFELWHSSYGFGNKRRHSFLLKEFEYDSINKTPYNNLKCLSYINVCKNDPFKIMSRGYYFDADDGINKVHIDFKYLNNDEAANRVAEQILMIVNENW